MANSGQEHRFPSALQLKTTLFIFLLTAGMTMNFGQRGCED